MYPTASSIQPDDHRPTSSFLPSPRHEQLDRYFPDHCARQTSIDRRKSEQEALLLSGPHKDTWQADRWNPPVSGLRTPPSDEMGTAYQVPNMASYENNHMHRSAYAPKAGLADRTRGAMGESIYDAATRYSASQGYAQQPPYQQQPLSQPQPQPQQYPHAQASVSLTSSSYQQQQPSASQGRSLSHVLPSTAPQQQPTARPATRPATPSSVKSVQSQSDDASTAARDAGMVLHNLQIPTCISPNGGDLADFTAQVSV